MTPSSRTPEGSPNRCGVCGKTAAIDDATPIRDATCPFCGSLIWLAPSERTAHKRNAPEVIVISADEVALLIKAIATLNEVAVGSLSRIVSAVGALGGVIWSRSPNDEMNDSYAVGIAKSEPEVVMNYEHAKLVRHIFQSRGKEIAIAPGESLADGVKNASNYRLLFCRFVTPRMPVRMIEVLQPNDGPVQAWLGFLMFTRQMTDYLARVVRLRPNRQRHSEAGRVAESLLSLRSVVELECAKIVSSELDCAKIVSSEIHP